MHKRELSRNGVLGIANLRATRCARDLRCWAWSSAWRRSSRCWPSAKAASQGACEIEKLGIRNIAVGAESRPRTQVTADQQTSKASVRRQVQGRPAHKRRVPDVDSVVSGRDVRQDVRVGRRMLDDARARHGAGLLRRQNFQPARGRFIMPLDMREQGQRRRHHPGRQARALPARGHHRAVAQDRHRTLPGRRRHGVAREGGAAGSSARRPGPRRLHPADDGAGHLRDAVHPQPAGLARGQPPRPHEIIVKASDAGYVPEIAKVIDAILLRIPQQEGLRDERPAGPASSRPSAPSASSTSSWAPSPASRCSSAASAS